LSVVGTGAFAAAAGLAVVAVLAAGFLPDVAFDDCAPGVFAAVLLGAPEDFVDGAVVDV